MSREILFRGKRLDNGEWVEGYLVEHPGSAFILKTGYPIPNNDFYSSPAWWASVDPATVGQFTGLHDRNGKRIFEGDVVRWGSFTASIKYKAPAFYYADNNDPMESTYLNPNSTCFLEVISNIHDKEG